MPPPRVIRGAEQRVERTWNSRQSASGPLRPARGGRFWTLRRPRSFGNLILGCKKRSICSLSSTEASRWTVNSPPQTRMRTRVVSALFAKTSARLPPPRPPVIKHNYRGGRMTPLSSRAFLERLTAPAVRFLTHDDDCVR